MLRFLIAIAGIALLGYGAYRAWVGPRAPLARGNSRAAVQIWATSLMLAVAGFTAFVLGLTGSVLATIAGLVIGGLLAVGGGAVTFRSMQRQIGSGH